ncbi:hypothetical protein [Sphingomonas sp. UYP23]
MVETIAASSQFVDAAIGCMWRDADIDYILGHPDWFTMFNVEAPQLGGKILENVLNIDLSENASLRNQVFDSWRRWNANQLDD